MRLTRTEYEQIAVKRFKSELKQANIDFIEDNSVVDCPDLVLEINRKRIGYELTILTNESFEKWKRQKKGLVYEKVQELRLPNSPELWLVDIIQKKNKKIQSYVSQRNLDEINLILHTSDSLSFSYDNETIKRLEYSCQETKNDFNEIWFINQQKSVDKLWYKGKPNNLKPKPSLNDAIVFKRISIIPNSFGSRIFDFGDEEPKEGNDAKSYFFRSAYFNNIGFIKQTIKDGIDVDLRDEKGYTILRYAAGRGNIEIVEYLLCNRADQSIMEFNQLNSLVEICERRGYSEIVELLKK